MAQTPGRRIRGQHGKFFQDAVAELVAYADNEFRRQDENQRVELALPALVYIWDWFTVLSPCRNVGMEAGAISHCEIKAWSELCGVGVTPAEVGAIRRIDQTLMLYRQEKNDPDRNISVSDRLGDAAMIAKAEREASRKRPSPPISKKR